MKLDILPECTECRAFDPVIMSADTPNGTVKVCTCVCTSLCKLSEEFRKKLVEASAEYAEDLAENAPIVGEGREETNDGMA